MILPADEILAFGPLLPWDGCRLLELGNKKNSGGLYRDFYTGRVRQYVSLDWNGQDGAIPIDMRYAISEDVIQNTLGGRFDVITNFGFTEHVDGQMACWANVHNLLKRDGWLVFCMPFLPHWRGHGLWQPPLMWYVELALLNGYRQDLLEVYSNRVRPTIIGRFLKVFETPFQMPKCPIDDARSKGVW